MVAMNEVRQMESPKENSLGEMEGTTQEKHR
jgi:hypothetical protein